MLFPFPQKGGAERRDGAVAGASRDQSIHASRRSAPSWHKWGMINGKLSALRWVLGDDWTCSTRSSIQNGPRIMNDLDVPKGSQPHSRCRFYIGSAAIFWFVVALLIWGTLFCLLNLPLKKTVHGLSHRIFPVDRRSTVAISVPGSALLEPASRPMQRAPHGQVVVPGGRAPGPPETAGANRSRRRHSRLRLRMPLEALSMSRDDSHYTAIRNTHKLYLSRNCKLRAEASGWDKEHAGRRGRHFRCAFS